MARLLVLAALAVLALPSAGAHAAPAHTVSLADGRVDGHRILGRSVAGVTAALGRPDFRAGLPSRYRIGWGSSSDFPIEVLFRRGGGALRAWSIVFERGVSDVKIGALLERSSSALQAAIRAQYGATFGLLRPYACKEGRDCVGEFAARSGSLHITFGTHPALGTWLTVWQSSRGG